MSTNYEIHICNCGRIHLISYDKLNKAFEENKEILHICAGCGRGIIFGADTIEPVFDNDEKMYDMYQLSFSHKEDTTIPFDSLNDTDFKEMIYSQGIKVPMMTGNYADFYYDGFYDTKAPNWDKILEFGKADDVEIIKNIREHTDNAMTINMQRFINETPHDILDEISNCYIEGLDWKGTKYDKY